MQAIELNELQTLAAGLVTCVLGTSACRRLRVLERLDIPSPVVGGLVVAMGVAALRSFANLEVHFASRLSDFLLLVFFTSVGLSAKLSALRAGGKPLLLLCAVTVFAIVAQNVVGVLVALSVGAHPYYGLLAGSISLVGGPGTAAAWAQEAQAAGLARAPEVAVAGATLAVISGALVAGPITGWIVRRERLAGPSERQEAPWLEPRINGVQAGESPFTIEQVMRTMLLIIGAVLVGDSLNGWAGGAGLVLPGFLTAMLGGALITNLADVFSVQLTVAPVQRNGQIALQAFLAMYLMSLKLWTVGAVMGPLLMNVVAQVVVTALIAYFLLFRVLGRDYDAALTSGGFLGFGLSSMAVGIATMDRLAERLGPSPKAFLLITLAGSFFVDLANAFVVRSFLSLPLFH